MRDNTTDRDQAIGKIVRACSKLPLSFLRPLAAGLEEEVEDRNRPPLRLAGCFDREEHDDEWR